LEVNGFYTKPTSKTVAKYNEFQVAEAGDSHAALTGESNMKQIGLITVAFYPDLAPATAASSSRSAESMESLRQLGTKLGEQHHSEIEVRACEKAGTMLSVIHLRYNTRENIEKLQAHVINK
jgi:hypothetical protein